MKYLGIAILFILGLVLVYSIGYGVYQGYVIEKPKYVVTEKFDSFEIREYESYIVAKVEVDPGARPGLDNGFIVLADYIFGNNTVVGSGMPEDISMTSPVIDSEKIEMTSPVINTQSSEPISMTTPVIDTNSSEKIAMTSPVGDRSEGDKRFVSFVMPSKFTMENLPRPNNPAVIIEEVENPKFAVSVVRGIGSQERMNNALEEMRNELTKEGIIFDESEFSFAYYDPPLTPWFLRKNEVLIELN